MTAGSQISVNGSTVASIRWISIRSAGATTTFAPTIQHGERRHTAPLEDGVLLDGRWEPVLKRRLPCGVVMQTGEFPSREQLQMTFN